MVTDQFRVFTVAAGGHLTLDRVRVSHGDVDGDGGGIHNAGTLILQNGSIVTGNTASGNGGGIYNSGTLQMSGGCLVGNRAASSTAVHSTVPVTISGVWWGRASGPGDGAVNDRVTATNPLQTAPAGCGTDVPTSPDSISIPDNADTLLFTSIVSPPVSHLATANRLLQNANTSTLNRVSLSQDLYGVCNSSQKPLCAKYSYLMFYAFFVEYTGNPPSLWDLFSAVYNGELGTYQGSQTSLQAFVRNFFDLQSGGCRFGGGGYTCTYDQLVEWLATSQFWIDRVKPSGTGTQMIVNVLGLTGEDIPEGTWDDTRENKPVSTSDLHRDISRGGMFNYDVKVRDAIIGNVTTWRSGQSPNHPSAWGNTVLPAGSTTYPAFNAAEQYDLVITHVFSNGQTTSAFNTNTNTVWGDGRGVINPQGVEEPTLPIPLTLPRCTYISVITTTEGRLANLSAC